MTAFSIHRFAIRLLFALLISPAVALPCCAQDAAALPCFAQDTDASPSEKADRAEPKSPDVSQRETKFEQSMRNVTMVGYFTASDQPAGKLSEERYVIDKVVKDEGENWVFHARIQYGKHDVPVRLKIPVKWAGDTPVISVTKLAVPLLGTFNARVLIYDGQYAGTWEGAGHGGQLFGRIEKNKAADNNATDDKAADDSATDDGAADDIATDNAEKPSPAKKGDAPE